MAIWQDLVDDHGFAARYASVRRFVRQLRGRAPVDARVVITTAAGEEAQVDYGDGPMVRHPATSKYRRTRLFVLTLGYSRKAVRLLVWASTAQGWAELHERAFRRLGGTPRVVVLDYVTRHIIRVLCPLALCARVQTRTLRPAGSSENGHITSRD
jgi:transposase